MATDDRDKTLVDELPGQAGPPGVTVEQDLTVSDPAGMAGGELSRVLQHGTGVSFASTPPGAPSSVHTPNFSGTVAPGEERPPEQRYLVLERLGGGGGGQVFAILDRHLEREVAAKVMQGSAANVASRFVSEARLTARLEHPNIVPVYDLGTDSDGRWFFTMRRASGRPLSELIAALGAGEPAASIESVVDRIAICVSVCDAIAYAHSRGIVHRDIKPSNIVLGDYGEITVLDWGTARELKDLALDVGKLIGTPLYMPPEQACGAAVDERSDVYSLGATLWQLLTLEAPAVRGTSSEEFWLRKASGDLPEPPPDVPAALIEIARRAMAPDPKDRYQSALELREALRNWQRHQTSVTLTDRASRLLEGAASYADFARAADGYQSALDEWAGNDQAREGYVRARAGHAALAIDRGDLELAHELVDPDDPHHAALRQKLTEARARRERARRRVTRLRAVSVAALAVAFCAAILFFLDHRRSIGQWHTLVDLRDPSALVKSLEPAFPTRNPRLAPEGGGVVLPTSHVYYLPPAGGYGNLSVTLDVEWIDLVDGLEITLRTRRGGMTGPFHFQPGYTCQFGGYLGAVSFVSESIVGRRGTANSVWIRFEPNRRYKLTFKLVDDEGILEVDGKERLRVTSLLPFGDASYQDIGVRSWAPALVRSIVVERQALPEKATALLAGDALARTGHLADAARAYEEVARDLSDTALAETALARAFLASESSDARAKLLGRLIDQYPRSRHRQRCEETWAHDLWQDGQHAEALDSATRILERFPMSRIAVSLVDMKVPDLAESVFHRLLGLVTRTPEVGRLDLNATSIVDLTPLEGASIAYLDLSGTKVRDLGPLRGMPLQNLVINATPVSSLEPLRGMSLVDVRLNRSNVTDLEPLRGMPLRRLELDHTNVSDLSPLSGVPLTRLSCSHSAVRDLRVVTGMPLQLLRAAHLGLTELPPIARSLLVLDVSGNEITNLAPLHAERWNELWLGQNQIMDVTPLASITADVLDLTSNRVADLAPLAGGRFARIDLTDNPVKSLAPLAGAGIRELHIAELGPVQIAPLLREPIAFIDASFSQIIDAERIADFGSLLILRGGLTHLDEERARTLAQELERLGRSDQIVRSVRLQSAIARRDLDLLRREAVRERDQLVLALPVQARQDAARALARELSGALPSPCSPAVQEAVRRAMPEQGEAFIEVRIGDGTLGCADGGDIPENPTWPRPNARSELFELVVVGRVGQDIYMSFRKQADEPRALVLVNWTE